MAGKAEFFSEELFTSPSIERTLACLDTVWDGPACHDVPNPYRKPYTLRNSWDVQNNEVGFLCLWREGSAKFGLIAFSLAEGKNTK
jgi:hypothetical protein